MTNICYVCREHTNLLHKICSCASSFICSECLKLTEQNINNPDNIHENRFKCQICRENLQITMIPNSRYYKSILKFYIFKMMFLLSDIIPLIYIYQYEQEETIYPTYFYTNRNHFILTNLFHIILSKNGAKMLLHNLYDFHDKIDLNYSLDILYLISNAMLFSICFLNSKTQFIDLYTIIVLYISYYFPFLIISLMCIMNKLGEVIKSLRKENQDARINILSHYYDPYFLIDEVQV